VTGGPAQYSSAVSQFLNAQDELISGQAATATGALAGDNMSGSDLTQLSNEDLADSPVATTMAANGEQDTVDTTALSNTLAMPSAGGTVTVYTTANETFTTVDTSAGSPVDIPGAITTDYLLTFTATGGTPQLTGYIDADGAFGQPGDGGTETAYSAALDGPAQTTPAPLESDSFGNLVTGTDSTSAPCVTDPGGGKNSDGSYYCSDLSAEVTWALNHSVPGTKKYYNGYLIDDCTDFSSRSLAFGGGLPEDVAPIPALPGDKHNDAYWYQYHAPGFTYTSKSWAAARHLADFFSGQGSYFLKYANNTKPGYIIFTQLNDQNNSSANFNKIDHDGVITVVNGTGIYITQHSPSYKNISLYRQQGRRSWFGDSPHMYIWVVVPSRKT
jgi:hypothetical protein